jgi:hypothetical protein
MKQSHSETKLVERQYQEMITVTLAEQKWK